jgi:hypothetical protein
VPQAIEHVHDPDREHGYRCGYVRGVEAAISGLIERIPDHDREQIAAWVKQVLTKWSMEDPTQVVPPPDFSRLIAMSKGPSESVRVRATQRTRRRWLAHLKQSLRGYTRQRADSYRACRNVTPRRLSRPLKPAPSSP